MINFEARCDVSLSLLLFPLFYVQLLSSVVCSYTLSV